MLNATDRKTLVNLGVNTMEMAMMIIGQRRSKESDQGQGQHQRGEGYQRIDKALHHKINLTPKIGAGDSY